MTYFEICGSCNQDNPVSFDLFAFGTQCNIMECKQTTILKRKPTLALTFLPLQFNKIIYEDNPQTLKKCQPY